jgi:hypothetical protein
MSDDLENLPPKLTADLKRAVDQPVGIPAALDATILLAAARHAARRRWWRRGIGFAAMAAVVLVTLGLVVPTIIERNKANRPQAALPMDLDHSGRVDILDAYALAKQLPNGSDLTGDHKVDQADVDAIAKVAVDLKGGTRP